VTKPAKGASDDELRIRAEERLTERRRDPVSGEAFEGPDAQRLVHELQVHQIELELQNEELRQTRAELEAALAHSTDLYELAPVGYLTLDPNGEILQVNLTGARLLGLERSKLVGRRFGRLVSTECGQVLTNFLARVFERGSGAVCEVVMNLEGAGPLELELKGTAVEDADLCRVVAMDITERKQLQASLAQADRLASIGMLAAGVAHEINNPLTYVLYNLSSLSDDVPEVLRRLGEVHRALVDRLGVAGLHELLGDADGLFDPALAGDLSDRFRDALEGTRRIRNVAKMLGTFSQVRTTEIEPLDLRSAIRSAIDVAYNEIKYRARVVTDFGTSSYVMGNSGQISQLFLNLLVNAAHAISEGNADRNEIRIRTWREGDEVCTEVRDTGCGIPADSLARIFDPFFTTKPFGTGFGLGLSLVKNIVTSLGGSVDVTSEVGCGTSFVVRLPAASAPAGEVEPAQPSAWQGRVLVVDDVAGVRSILRLFLTRHEVVEAESGERALSILAEDQAFDVILCDLMMPNVSGVDVHAWLVREHPGLASRLIFMTGGAFAPATREYLTTVENAVIEKPFNGKDIEAMVDALVASSRSEPRTV
jgi:two-component system, cell cycle sensor histidine kinase and response regulator CckA